MKQIKLTNGQVALVDDSDYEELNRFKWNAHNRKRTFYAIRSTNKGGRREGLRMHRVLMKVTDPQISVDHKDGNGLNNQRDNLRICTWQENAFNRKPIKNKSSIHKGVQKEGNKWRAVIYKNQKRKHIGMFESEIEAATAYNKAAVELFGEFANLNATEVKSNL